MSGDTVREQLQAELVEVDNDLAGVRRNAAQARGGVGEADDPTDRGALIQGADEQDEIADQLTARREDLLRRLAEAGT
jgi:hypothetical protein